MATGVSPISHTTIFTNYERQNSDLLCARTSRAGSDLSASQELQIMDSLRIQAQNLPGIGVQQAAHTIKIGYLLCVMSFYHRESSQGHPESIISTNLRVWLCPIWPSQKMLPGSCHQLAPQVDHTWHTLGNPARISCSPAACRDMYEEHNFVQAWAGYQGRRRCQAGMPVCGHIQKLALYQRWHCPTALRLPGHRPPAHRMQLTRHQTTEAHGRPPLRVLQSQPRHRHSASESAQSTLGLQAP